MSISSRLSEILKAENLTIYGASQIIGAETDDPLKTVHERLSVWMRKPPKTWVLIEESLAALGYEITIQKKESSNEDNADG